MLSMALLVPGAASRVVAAEPPPVLLPERFESRVGGESFLGLAVPDFRRGPIAISSRVSTAGARIVGDISRSAFVAVFEDGTRRDAVAYRYRTELVVDLRLPSGLTVGAGLPFVQQRGRIDRDVPKYDGDTLGDGWLEAIMGWRFASDGHFGFAARVTAPTGNEDITLGVGTPALLVEGLTGWQVHPLVLLVANVGWRTVQIFGPTKRSAGDEFVYRLGATVEIDPALRGDIGLDGAVAIEGERIDARGYDSAIAPLEARLGFRWNTFSSAAAIRGGVGFGLTRGQGTPLARFILGLDLACALGDCPMSGGADRDGDGIDDRSDRCPDRAGRRSDGAGDGCPAGDRDGDGITDDVDQCPVDMEDLDGFADDDGCPERDDDKDGVLDVDEDPLCLLRPEDIDGFQDDDGCPDEDDDDDGILDIVDRCPRKDSPGMRLLIKSLAGPLSRSDDPRRRSLEDRLSDPREDFDGFEDSDGCPDLDHDGDGIIDEIDDCPVLPGGEANGGCSAPIGPDRDADGIEDDFDRCPDRAESRDGIFDLDGCPEHFSTATLTDTLQIEDSGRIRIKRRLPADTAEAAAIRESSAALAELLRLRPDLGLVIASTSDRLTPSSTAARLIDAITAEVSDRRITTITRCGIAPSGDGPIRVILCSTGDGGPTADALLSAGWPPRLMPCDADARQEGQRCAIR